MINTKEFGSTSAAAIGVEQEQQGCIYPEAISSNRSYAKTISKRMRIHELCLKLRNIKYLAKLCMSGRLAYLSSHNHPSRAFISKKDLGLHLEPPMAFNMSLVVKVNNRLEVWTQVLESKGFRLSRTKTDYLECKFSNIAHKVEVEVKTNAQVIPKRGSSRDGEIDNDIAHIGADDKKMPSRLKGKFYKVVVRPTFLHGEEYLSVKNANVQQMKKRSHISQSRNGGGQDEEAKLRSYGHAKRRGTDVPTRRCERLDITGVRRGRDRPKKNRWR
ncbi:hypothetical protein H5410_023815 [Solanum commersonii]|uniref:Uncharacterized protein n=1 Tax=Solanum commersonii TaxID=4109 RepID=A0A9J5ZK70_SOLCO|nr:hypothetical protein H5410_023815 [Solanum commersonii]